ncbi:MAG: arginase [Salibacteraceae bacterium]
MLKYLVQCSEIGAGTRGSSLGPDAIMLASLNSSSDLFNRHPFEQIPDLNDSLFEPTNTPNALRIRQMHTTWTAQAEAVLRNMRLGKIPVLISGDHASAGGTIAGIKMAHPDKRLGVVWIDAHADMHSPYTTPSGNIHGMPLACSLGFDNLERKRNDPNEETVDYWNRMKNLGGIMPKIWPNDLVFVGVRDTEPEESYLLEKYNISNYEVEEVDELGMEKIGRDILEELGGCDLIYVSFDVDSMDPEEVSYGTGTPVPDGITPDQAIKLLSILLADHRVCCFEMVEVNPLLDKKGNKMATTALGILERAVETFENR